MVEQGIVVHVAVGVILDQNDRVLIAKRAPGQHQGGLWEFPGGKVDAGESVEQALARELHEELAIGVRACRELLKVQHDYGDKSVLLDVWVVSQFTGVAHGNEGQEIAWVSIDTLCEYQFPAANVAIVRAIEAGLSRKD